eukprot:Nk52_evm12s1400 gene=Nk52_evmTU12s1400
MKERLAARGLSTGEKAGEVVDGITNSKYNKNVHHRLDELEEKDLYYFRKLENIVPFIDRHWAFLCQGRTRTATWAATVGSCLYTRKVMFVSLRRGSRTANSPFTLMHPDLFDINPDCFTQEDEIVMAKVNPHTSGGSLEQRPLGTVQGKRKTGDTTSVGLKKTGDSTEPARHNLISRQESWQDGSNAETSEPTSVHVSQELSVKISDFENHPHVAYGWIEDGKFVYQDRQQDLMTICPCGASKMLEKERVAYHKTEKCLSRMKCSNESLKEEVTYLKHKLEKTRSLGRREIEHLKAEVREFGAKFRDLEIQQSSAIMNHKSEVNEMKEEHSNKLQKMTDWWSAKVSILTSELEAQADLHRISTSKVCVSHAQELNQLKYDYKKMEILVEDAGRDLLRQKAVLSEEMDTLKASLDASRNKAREFARQLEFVRVGRPQNTSPPPFSCPLSTRRLFWKQKLSRCASEANEDERIISAPDDLRNLLDIQPGAKVNMFPFPIEQFGMVSVSEISKRAPIETAILKLYPLFEGDLKFPKMLSPQEFEAVQSGLKDSPVEKCKYDFWRQGEEVWSDMLRILQFILLYRNSQNWNGMDKALSDALILAHHHLSKNAYMRSKQCAGWLFPNSNIYKEVIDENEGHYKLFEFDTVKYRARAERAAVLSKRKKTSATVTECNWAVSQDISSRGSCSQKQEFEKFKARGRKEQKEIFNSHPPGSKKRKANNQEAMAINNWQAMKEGVCFKAHVDSSQNNRTYTMQAQALLEEMEQVRTLLGSPVLLESAHSVSDSVERTVAQKGSGCGGSTTSENHKDSAWQRSTDRALGSHHSKEESYHLPSRGNHCEPLIGGAFDKLYMSYFQKNKQSL